MTQSTYYLAIVALGSTLIGAMDFQQNFSAPVKRHRITPDHVITFFIRPCFCSRECIEKDDVTENLQDPNFINRNTINYCLKTIRQQGIHAVYYGMTTHSDANGQIIFPRQQISDDVLLVVTNKPRPLLGQGVTVNKWVVAPHEAAFYTYTQQTIKGQLVWHIQKIDTPKNLTIPPQAIIIIADPSEIIIHEGLTSTVHSASLTLPTIYTKKSINLDKDALLFLNINRYFDPTKKVVNYSQDRYAIMVQP